MSVHSVTQAELEKLGAVETVDGQVALNLAAILDDRAGIQGGGVASTAKELRATMAAVRESARPAQRTALSVLRAS